MHVSALGGSAGASILAWMQRGGQGKVGESGLEGIDLGGSDLHQDPIPIFNLPYFFSLLGHTPGK